VAWTSAGGNLFVYGVGDDWQRMPELESRLELPPGSADARSDPSARGWREPDLRSFGRPLRGIGSSGRGGESPYIPVYPGMAYSAPSVDVPEEVHAPAAREGPPDRAPFVFRDFDLGLIVALATEDPFPGSEAQWGWLLNTIGSKRWVWYQRHGMSPMRPNPDFWKFLIPGVGQAPVTAFQVLITLFVLGIGPLNYFLLRRSKRLHLLVVTVPLSAGAITLALFAYAVLADGLGTRVRVRSVTQIDQRRGHAACWSRLSFYAGLAPAGGLTFPADVAVLPLEYVPGDRRSGGRELAWEGDQRLRSGWLNSRTPTQFLTLRSRKSGCGLTLVAPDGGSEGLGFTNRLGTTIQQLLVRAEDGGYYWATNVGAGGKTVARPIDPAKGVAQLQRAYREHEPAYPPYMDRNSLPDISSYSGPGYWGGDLPEPTARSARLEEKLKVLRTPVGNAALTLAPRSYVAIVERSPEVVLGTPSAREEAGFHVVQGTW